MAKNNSHLGETAEGRLKRLQDGSPVESIETLLNSIDNFFNNEIRATVSDLRYPQTTLMFLGVHAAILTISEVFFNDKGSRGYKLFLERYVDKDDSADNFSLIANDIHAWRNIVAHQWLSIKGHSLAYAYNLDAGWKREGSILHINPKIYCEQYLAAFNADGRIWRYSQQFTQDELEAIKQRIIEKFVKE